MSSTSPRWTGWPKAVNRYTAARSASSHDLSERKQIDRLPRRSATNPRADQQSGGACVAYRRLTDDYKMLLIRPIIIL